jgi:hypothetical protein
MNHQGKELKWIVDSRECVPNAALRGDTNGVLIVTVDGQGPTTKLIRNGLAVDDPQKWLSLLRNNPQCDILGVLNPTPNGSAAVTPAPIEEWARLLQVTPETLTRMAAGVLCGELCLLFVILFAFTSYVVKFVKPEERKALLDKLFATLLPKRRDVIRSNTTPKVSGRETLVAKQRARMGKMA